MRLLFWVSGLSGCHGIFSDGCGGGGGRRWRKMVVAVVGEVEDGLGFSELIEVVVVVD